MAVPPPPSLNIALRTRGNILLINIRRGPITTMHTREFCRSVKHVRAMQTGGHSVWGAAADWPLTDRTISTMFCLLTKQRRHERWKELKQYAFDRCFTLRTKHAHTDLFRRQRVCEVQLHYTLS